MRRKLLLLALVLGLTLSGVMAGIAAAAAYRYDDLSLQGLSNSLFITAINDSAWIVGYYNHPSAHTNQPFVWRPGLGRTNLQNPSYPLAASAHGINNQGQIVGQANSLSLPGIDACYWSGPAAIPVALPTTQVSLFNNCAYGINEAGEVAGEGQFGDPVTAPIHAARWPANHSTATDLNTLGGSYSNGRSINCAGWVVGYAENSPPPSHGLACLWVPEQQPQPIPAPTQALPAVFTYANAINDQGNVLGHAQYGLGLGQAFFWNYQTGVSQLVLPDAYSALAAGMSEANQVVGWYENMLPNYSSGVFYWTPGGGSQGLNQMVVNLPAGVTLSSAAAISRNGKYITGFDSQGHPYLLTAIASPAPIMPLLLLD
jgi:uncharacterized membrane protein